MAWIDEKLTEQFYRWELRGRGWWVFPEPVRPEPPFRPFLGHYLPRQPIIDDGRKPTFLSSFVESFGKPKPAPPPVEEPEEEPLPESLERGSLIELQTSLPANLNIRAEEFDQFLSSLSLCREPVTFELLGTPEHVTAQFAAHPQDAGLLHQQLRAYFPDVVFTPREGALQKAWQESGGADTAVVEFGLGREFMLPLATTRIDAFVGIVAALAELQAEELALYQVIFEPVANPWAESIVNSVTDNEGKPFFANAPEIATEAEKKVARPLYGVVVRLATKSSEPDRAWEIARQIASALGVFARPGGNELIPLKNDDYPFEEHQADVLRRQCHRSGMLLNSEELTGFVHLPSAAVRAPELERQTGRTRQAPAVVQSAQGLFLGNNQHAGKTIPVRLTPEQRVRHLHLIGASGTGKSTLLFNMMCQGIEDGEGLAVLDPHGDLIDRLLGVIPEHRIDDVVLLDPADEAYSVGFNILSAHSDFEKNVLASDLVSVFQRLSTSWGDQMGSVLQNAIMAFLESSEGGTLADLRRFLIEPEFRNRFLTTVGDPDIVYYWQKGFAQLTGNKSIGPVLTRLETFLSPKPIRYMVSQKENRLDFARIMNTGKIFLARLPQGQIGRENAFLLGSLLVAKFQQTAMARQGQAAATRKDFWLYLDEFQNFITPSMAEILTGARKYRLGLVLAHQELRQLQRDSEVASAVLANPGTRICFRLGDEDARKLAEGFAHFEARDLQNLEKGQAICRIERSDWDFNLAVPLPDEPDPAQAAAIQERVVASSRQKYGTPRAAVEARLARNYAPAAKSPAPVSKPEPAGTVPPPPPVPVAQPEPVKGVPVPPPQPVEPPLPPVVAPTKPAEPPAVAPRAVETPKPPADMGRGGAQHQAIQQRLKKAAEDLGFRATIERPTPDGGSVDLFLERGDTVIACEISITTTIDHEVGNVAKCLKAGYPIVGVVCADPNRLERIATAVASSLGADEARRVRYWQPEELLVHLETIPRPSVPPAAPDIAVRRGYKIRRSTETLSCEEKKQREDEAINSMAEAMRRRRKKVD